MATLKRSKTMPADGQTAKFLYTILKQLDLKSIDWNLVASQLEISNGHAARMRFSRFRQHMEGTPTNPRGSRPKKQKTEKAAAQSKKLPFDEKKLESLHQVKPEPAIKPEPLVDPRLNFSSPMETSGLYAPSPYIFTTVAPSELTLPCPTVQQPMGYLTPPIGGYPTLIKAEHFEDGLFNPGIMVKREA